METEKEHNNRILEQFGRPTDTGTGVACADCGGELHHFDNVVLTSNPPQRNVVCSKCGRKTTIY